MNKENRFIDLLKILTKKRMLIVFILGFSSGLPIMLFYSNIKIWMRREGVDLSTIGYLSWITIPYSLNFIWSFLLDRLTLNRLGRRRGWILLTQIFLVIFLIVISFGDPKISISFIVYVGILLCFFSATQDIAVDAYRREILPDNELGLGASLGVYGYRVGMLVASSFGLWIVDKDTWNFSFNQMFLVIAAFMSIGIIGTFMAEEPKHEGEKHSSFYDSIVGPFKDFFTRPMAGWILLFILMFKMGDAIGGSMLGSFYVDMGFDNKVIAEVKGLGAISSMLGLFIGGWSIFRLGLFHSLWIFGILQSLSTAAFATLTLMTSQMNLAFVIVLEDITSGMGTAAMVTFMAKLTNKKFTATQYALLASVASLGRTYVSGFSGVLIEKTNYFQFFVICGLLAVPGLIILMKIRNLDNDLYNT